MLAGNNRRMGRDCFFRCYCPHAARVEVVLELLPSPVCMRCGEEGWWELRLQIPERPCSYHFLIDGRYTMPDYSAGEPVYDSRGNLVSVLGDDRPGAGRAARRAGRAAGRERASATANPADRHPQAG
jgi:1,4-alpha-glucan branching enzyme